MQLTPSESLAGAHECRFRIDFRPLLPTAPPGSPLASVPGAIEAVTAPIASPPAGKASGKGASSKGGPAGAAAAVAAETIVAGTPAALAAAIAASAANARIVLHSDQLGDFIYELRLKSTEAGAEPPLRFACALGARQSSFFRFRHLDARGLVYKCATTRPECFSVVATVTAPPNTPLPLPGAPAAGAPPSAAPPGAAAAAPGATTGSGSGPGGAALLPDPWLGTELVVEVAYEGVAVGDTAAELHVASEVGGAFVVPLLASCRCVCPGANALL